ncbi:hypothetical protein V0U79_04810 [Hyphobacterium sp. HN65]|uniref:DUF4129 domain-containing protein n=1 Tax=Hyphobacterium lacteum TaxID=3116575 RepID=A0ABU7LP42_9PROT|nr:hypothetical protein [Hyphobacterium sp. HN65]MEE2525678.1 hypothetical protein [Hyphobacterium sp. HN65]
MRDWPDAVRWLFHGARSGFQAVVFAVLIAACLPGALDAAQDAPARDYVDIADDLNLQSDLEILSADEDWRARLGVEENQERPAEWWELVPWGLVIRIVIWGLAAGLLATIAYLIWRYGAVIQVGLSAKVDEGRTGDPDIASGSVLSAEPKALSLDDVLAMEDAGRALGALQRLVLEAALAAMNASLRKSDTARAVLRRLPRDWQYYPPVAALVRRAERVRFAGDSFDREGLESVIESVRPVLHERGQARG